MARQTGKRKAAEPPSPARSDTSTSSAASFLEHEDTQLCSHITWDNDRSGKLTTLNSNQKQQAEKLIDDWDCPNSIAGTSLPGTLKEDKKQGNAFRIDLQGTFVNQDQKYANIQEQLNINKTKSSTTNTTVSTVILPCDENIGYKFIKEGLKRGLDENKGKIYVNRGPNPAASKNEARRRGHKGHKPGPPKRDDYPHAKSAKRK